MKKNFFHILITHIIIYCNVLNAQNNTLLNFEGTSNGKSPYGSLVSDGTYLYVSGQCMTTT